MSSAGSIIVEITARETDLRAQLALAKADVSRFTAEVKSLSSEMVSTGKTADAALTSSLRTASTSAAQAGRTVSSLDNELRKITPAANQAHGSIATATREFRALFDELSSGRTRMTPGTLAIIATRVFGLSGASLAALGGVVALGAAIGYLVVKSIEAANELDRLKLATDFGGNLAITKDQLHQFADEAGRDGDAIVASYAHMSQMSASQLEALSIATAQYAEAAGEKAPEAIKQLEGVLNGQRISLTELEKLFPATTEKTRENFIATQQLGDAHKTTAALVGLVDEQVKGSRQDLIAYSSGWTSVGNDIRYVLAYVQDFTGEMLPLSGAVEGAIKIWDQWGTAISHATTGLRVHLGTLNSTSAVDRVHQAMLAENKKRLDDQATAAGRAAAAMSRQHDSDQATITSGMQAAETFGTETRKIDEVTAALNRMHAAQHAKGVTGDEQKMLAAAIADAQKQLGDEQKRRSSEEYSNFVAMENAKVSATKTGSAERIAALAAEADKARQLFGAQSTEYYEAVSRMNEAKQEGVKRETAAFTKGGEEEVAAMREAISEINADEKLGSAERVAAIHQEFDTILASQKLNTQQRLAVEKEYNDELAAEHKKAAQEQDSIAKNTASTDLQIARLGFTTKRELLQQEVSDGKLTAAQELATLKDTAADELRIELAAENQREKGYAQDSAQYAAAENEKRLLQAQFTAENTKLDAQIVAANEKAARADAQSWTMAIDEITGAERSFIDTALSQRGSFMQAVYQLTSQFIKKELADDLAYYTKKMLLSNEAFAADAAHEQGGILVHLVAENSKTAATVTNTGARKAATASEEATENASFVVRAARWLASELGMTAATTTQTATRVTEQASAEATGKAEASAANVATAQSNAAVAATGAAASVAAIPFVGWTLAPGVAAETFAGLQGYVALAAFASGTNYVTRDTPALVHEGERIMPKADNRALMTALSGGGGSSSRSVHNEFNYAPVNHMPQSRSLSQMLDEDAGTMRAWFQTQVRNGALRLG